MIEWLSCSIINIHIYCPDVLYRCRVIVVKVVRKSYSRYARLPLSYDSSVKSMTNRVANVLMRMRAVWWSCCCMELCVLFMWMSLFDFHLHMWHDGVRNVGVSHILVNSCRHLKSINVCERSFNKDIFRTYTTLYYLSLSHSQTWALGKAI